MNDPPIPSSAFPSPREAETLVHAMDRCVREVPISALKQSPRGTVRVVNRRALLTSMLEVVDAFLAHRIQGLERELAAKVDSREQNAHEEGQLRVLFSLADLYDTVEAVVAGFADPLAGQALTRRLERLFGTYGFERIKTVGSPFDPNLHEAVESEPVPGFDRGAITREVNSGFRRGEFVLRTARVIVAE